MRIGQDVLIGVLVGLGHRGLVGDGRCDWLDFSVVVVFLPPDVVLYYMFHKHRVGIHKVVSHSG